MKNLRNIEDLRTLRVMLKQKEKEGIFRGGEKYARGE